MKIVINTAHQRFGGAIQVAISFIQECRKYPEHEYYVWLGSGTAKSINQSDFTENFHFKHFDFGVISFLKTITINKVLSMEEKGIKPDIIIATSGPTYHKAQVPQIIGFNLPLYIYPESPFLINLSFRKKIKLYLKKRVHFYFFKRDANAYVAQTDDVNKRVRKELNSTNVHTVTNTCSSFFRGEIKSFPSKLDSNESENFRWLTISAYYPHKNLDIIPKILDILKSMGIDNVEFILTLKDEDFKNHFTPHEGLRNIGPVSPEECPSLYKECDGMFLPSQAECFSASYPEAMVMQKPILTSNLDFARSICGEAASYFNSDSAESAALEAIKIMTDENLRESLIEKGKKQLDKFDTPEQRAFKYLNLATQLNAGKVAN